MKLTNPNDLDWLKEGREDTPRLAAERLLANISGVDNPQTGFKTLPKGWDRSSVEKSWNSLGRSFYSCRRKMRAKGWSKRKASRFCAALKDEYLGTEEWRGEGSHADVQADLAAAAARPDGSDLSDRAIAIDADVEDANALAQLLADTLDDVGIEVGGENHGDHVHLTAGDDDRDVFVTATGDGYVVAGLNANTDLLALLQRRLAAAGVESAVARPVPVLATYAFTGPGTIREAAQHVRGVVDAQLGDDRSTELHDRDGQFAIVIRGSGGAWDGSLIVEQSPQADEFWNVTSTEGTFEGLADGDFDAVDAGALSTTARVSRALSGADLGEEFRTQGERDWYDAGLDAVEQGE
jgi:hypothetical protein